MDEEQTKYEIDWSAPVNNEEFWENLDNPDFFPQNELGVTDEVLTRYYQAAAKILDEKQWLNARDAFIFLNFLNPTHQNFWIGLGVAEQSLGEFSEAISAYLAAEILDSTNPVPHANAFQCHLALGHQDAADQSYKKCIEACGDKPEFASIKSSVSEYKERNK
jgi:tetratricopeptide (TPR) repeat protein